ncbi:MAG TPA: ATP-binding cassette domain-containing protein, partial [Thermoleophilia bacterium]|nr:ATP-binding cassette domain-containing protein [Thermoleophilia bacterium]
KQAKAKLTQIQRIKRDLKEPPKQGRSFKLGLPQPTPSARVVLEMKTPALNVGSADDPAGVRALVRNVDVVLERGEKVALLGPNGSGKTTLVETVAGMRSLARGVSHLGHNTRVAYYSQQGRELTETDTCLQTVLPLVAHDEQQARKLLGRFQFGPEEVEKRVEMLSGGERSRLRLLTLLVGDANFLLLDEPTNHLDMGSVEALADALEDYTGTLLLVTHDRHLIDRVASRVLEIEGSELLNHLSATRYWEARTARTADANDGTAPTVSAQSGDRAPSGEAAARRAAAAAPAGAAKTRQPQRTAEEARRHRARLRASEAAVLRAEERLGAIDDVLAEPETYADRDVLNRLLDERNNVEGLLQREYQEWEKLVDEQA